MKISVKEINEKCDKFTNKKKSYGWSEHNIECVWLWDAEHCKMDYGSHISLDLWILIIYILGKFLRHRITFITHFPESTKTHKFCLRGKLVKGNEFQWIAVLMNYVSHWRNVTGVMKCLKSWLSCWQY